MLAAAAWADGQRDDTGLLNGLAKAGSWGTFTGNILRDVINAARRAGLMDSSAQAYEFLAPGPDGQQVSIKCFLPHEVYHKLVQESSLDDWTLPPGSDSPLAGLLLKWQAAADVTVEHDLARVAGVGLHADGVQYTSSMRAGEAKSIYVSSFNIITATDISRRAKRRLFFVLSKDKLCNCGCQGYDTFQAIFQVFSWSMHHLMTGRSPSCRHDGQPWTAREVTTRLPSDIDIFPAALIQVRGDWDWYTTGFRFRASGGNPFCWMCDARKDGAMTYRNFSPDAPHRGTLMSHDVFMEQCIANQQQPSTIFRCPGMRLEFIAVDFMHTADLGVFPDALGSLFWLHVTHKSWYKNRLMGLKQLNKELDLYFAANRYRRMTPTSRLTIRQIRAEKPGYPFLKVKAAQARHLCEFGLLMAQRHEHGDPGRTRFAFRPNHPLAGRTAEHNALVTQVFQAMVDMQRSIVASPFEPDACKTSIYQLLNAFDRLNTMWRQGRPERECKVCLGCFPRQARVWPDDIRCRKATCNPLTTHVVIAGSCRAGPRYQQYVGLLGASLGTCR